VTFFRHGVASGDPERDRVVVWTRATADPPRSVRLRWTVARDPGLAEVVAEGQAEATADSDYTAQVDVGGLTADTHYWYAFEADGEQSPLGRTRTLPGPDVEHLRFAVVSCAKFNSGFFNGYARIAERDDLQFVLHLGDYIYEASQTPPASQTPGADIGRPFDPLHECVTLDDYRRRYAQYHTDPDTQAVHAAHAMLLSLDDHEFADGAWRGGSDEHKPERDGPWEQRRAAAFQARREWLPDRLPDPAHLDRVFRSVSLGGLADLFLIDTRSRRDQPVSGPAMHDENRSQLGTEQRDWLFDGLDRSGATWRLLANGSILARTWAPDISEALRSALHKLKLTSADGGPDPDQWDGYPVEREALLDHIQGRNAIVFSGDVHVAWAIELERETAPGRPVAVEFVTASLTSQNLDDKTGWGYRTQSLEAERQLLEALPNVRFCDMDSHGYMVVDVTPERVRVEWWFVDGVLERTSGERLAYAVEVAAGSQSIVPAG
jgi:alkaline phosphatase D